MSTDTALGPAAASSRLPTSRVGRLMALMVVLLTAIFGGIGWLQTQSLALLNANVVYQGDNIVWSFFQLETESLRLGQALREAAVQPDPAPFDALRERYEIFVSRISLVEPQRTRDVMPELEAHRPQRRAGRSPLAGVAGRSRSAAPDPASAQGRRGDGCGRRLRAEPPDPHGRPDAADQPRRQPASGRCPGATQAGTPSARQAGRPQRARARRPEAAPQRRCEAGCGEARFAGVILSRT